MKVKKTKTGKISIHTDLNERENIFDALVNFLEAESVEVRKVKLTKKEDVMRLLYYYTLNDFLTNKDFHLQTTDDKKISLNHPQAVALMWLLRDHDNTLSMLLLKSSLHKLLC